MDILSTLGWIFGLVSLSLAVAAIAQIGRLEEELKRRGVIDENFGLDRPKKLKNTAPRSWSPTKRARVSASKQKVVLQSLKVAIVLGLPIAALILLVQYSKGGH